MKAFKFLRKRIAHKNKTFWSSDSNVKIQFLKFLFCSFMQNDHLNLFSCEIVLILWKSFLGALFFSLLHYFKYFPSTVAFHMHLSRQNDRLFLSTEYDKLHSSQN